MPIVVPNWLADHVTLPHDADAAAISEALVRVGIEEETLHPAAVTGPLVVGRVLAKTSEPQKNGKTINWCLVDVGPLHNTRAIAGVTEAEIDAAWAAAGPGPSVAAADSPAGATSAGAGDVLDSNQQICGARGIVCGAHNFEVGDYVVVALPGTVLPGPFPIAARKTYGHVSDGMICSNAELGLPDDGTHGIIVLPAGEATPGQDAIALLGLGDEVLEVNVTPDRGYQFSYRGVAREYGLATGAEFIDPVIALAAKVPVVTDDAFPVIIDDKTPIRGVVGCDRFATRIVRGINPKAETPKWMRQRLEQSGIRSISLPVDITNYVMLDLGQPVHAYDLDKMSAPIVVRRAVAGERLTTLDDADRALDVEDLLITDSPKSSVTVGTGGLGRDGAVTDGARTDARTAGIAGSRVLGLAGVMGGASTEISDSTTNVLVECAHFDPVSVARTARRHKLPSEAAKRFERGVDPELPPVAAQMVVDLLVQYAGGTADPAVGDTNQTATASSIELPLGLPERIVGIPYSPETIIKTLESIGAQVSTPLPPAGSNNVTPSVEESQGLVSKPRETTITVTPPSWRPDLTEPVDLVEEIVRIDGYDKVPSVLPAAPGSRGLTSSQRLRRTVARTLAEAGLVEVLTYPFVGPKDWEATHLPAAAATLANPLSADRPDLRSNLLITLLDAAKRNAQRGLTDFGLFEIGLVTKPSATTSSDKNRQQKHLVPPVGQRPDAETLTAIHGSLPEQPRQVAAVLVGEVDPSGWWGKGRAADWSDALALANLVAERAGLTLQVTAEPGGTSWHPGRSAYLEIAGQPGVRIGIVGELHPKVVANFGLPARAVAFELDLSALSQASDDAVTRAVAVSAYPLAKEDFAFVVPADTPAAVVENAIVTGAGGLLESVSLFDIYSGEQLGANRKSLAFNVRLRAADRTLTIDDVKTTRDNIVAAAAQVGAELRG